MLAISWGDQDYKYDSPQKLLPLVKSLFHVFFLASNPSAPVLLTLSSSIGTTSAPPLFDNCFRKSASLMSSTFTPNSSLIAADKSNTLLNRPGLIPLLYILDPRRVSIHMHTMMTDQRKLKMDIMNRKM